MKGYVITKLEDETIVLFLTRHQHETDPPKALQCYRVANHLNLEKPANQGGFTRSKSASGADLDKLG